MACVIETYMESNWIHWIHFDENISVFLFLCANVIGWEPFRWCQRLRGAHRVDHKGVKHRTMCIVNIISAWLNTLISNCCIQLNRCYNKIKIKKKKRNDKKGKKKIGKFQISFRKRDIELVHIHSVCSAKHNRIIFKYRIYWLP